MHYALVGLHVRVQTAVAYEMLGKHDEAHTLLSKAVSDASGDEFVMPFVENYGHLEPVLVRETQNDFITQIIKQGEITQQYKAGVARPSVFTALTEREYEIVCMVVKRLSNREIADKLFLSEGSVKQYVNRIYSKLHIVGDTRTKRKQLTDLFL